MKICYLKIRNFKSIRELEIKNVESAMILVGKNNTGKTAVIDALLLAAGMRTSGKRFKLLSFQRHYQQGT